MRRAAGVAVLLRMAAIGNFPADRKRQKWGREPTVRFGQSFLPFQTTYYANRNRGSLRGLGFRRRRLNALLRDTRARLAPCPRGRGPERSCRSSLGSAAAQTKLPPCNSRQGRDQSNMPAIAVFSKTASPLAMSRATRGTARASSEARRSCNSALRFESTYMARCRTRFTAST